MVIESLSQLNPNDVVYMSGFGYVIDRILGEDAYVHSYGTKRTCTYMLCKEGTLYTISKIKGDRCDPWFDCSALHYLKPVALYPGLE